MSLGVAMVGSWSVEVEMALERSLLDSGRGCLHESLERASRCMFLVLVLVPGLGCRDRRCVDAEWRARSEGGWLAYAY